MPFAVKSANGELCTPAALGTNASKIQININGLTEKAENMTFNGSA